MTDATNQMMQRRKDSPNGAGHYHLADPYPFQIRVLIGGREVASTRDAIILKEVGTSLYNPTFYIPPGDVQLQLFRREPDFTTQCPIKGAASYWAFVGSGAPVQRAAWSYETPLDYSKMIAKHLGFDQRFATIEISPL